MKPTLDLLAAGVAFTTHWLRGRYGEACVARTDADEYRWNIEPAGTRRPFTLSVEAAALENGLGYLRDRLDEIAEHALAHPPKPTERYHVTLTGVELRTS